MEQSEQFEFFDSVCQKRARRSVLISEPIQLSFRQDHGVLLVIAVLVVTSAVFAFGVERGKRISISEKPLIKLQKTADKTQETTTEIKTANSNETSEATFPIKKEQNIVPTKNTNTSTEQKAKTKLASDKQFAIQVVSFKKNDLAHKELARLRNKGEPVFMIMKEGRTSLLIGPFKNKETASAKLTNLRKKYQDCFIRTLSGYNATTM